MAEINQWNAFYYGVNAVNRRIKIILEYDGTDFCGWQSQREGAPSIQDIIEAALAKLFQSQIRITAAGRTDAGVHAKGQVISFVTESKIPLHGILRGGNSLLPESVRFLKVEDAPLSFNPRRDARLRWYRHTLINRIAAPAMMRQYMAHIPYRLDFDLLDKACNLFVGVHDFAAFRSADCNAKRTRLNLETFEFQREDDILRFDLKCRSFLQNMVRILIGAVTEAARGRLSLDFLQETLESGKKDSRIPTAPACGLTLMKVYY